MTTPERLKSAVLDERFWSKVDKAAPVPKHRPELGPCWTWGSSRNDKGYGYYGIGPVKYSVHRLSFTHMKGDIPEGMEIDHLCRVRNCVNPAHLEAVTHAENLRRAGRAKTRCNWGHDLTPQNTYIRKSGWRLCRICQRLSRDASRRGVPMEELMKGMAA